LQRTIRIAPVAAAAAAATAAAAAVAPPSLPGAGCGDADDQNPEAV